jgi:hypothetical protein
VHYKGIDYLFVNEKGDFRSFRYRDRKTRELSEIILHVPSGKVKYANLARDWNRVRLFWHITGFTDGRNW